MASYGYSYRVSYTAPQTTENWGKTSYDSDKVRPAIVDANARNGAVVPLSPPNIDSYGNRIESRQEYVVSEDNLNKNRASDYNREAEEFIARVKTQANRPWFSPSAATHLRSSPEKPTGYNTNTGGLGDRNGYSDKDRQTSPKSTGVKLNGGHGVGNGFSGTDWQQNSPKSPVFSQNNSGYGDRNDLSGKDWLQNSSNGGFNEHNGSGTKNRLKPDSYTDPNDVYEDYLRKPPSTKPHHVSWAKPAEQSLSSPTNDIGTAIGNLIEAAKPSVVTYVTAATGNSIPTAFFTAGSRPSVPTSSQYSQFAEPVYAKTTDVQDVEKRYGRYNFSSKPYSTRI